MILTSFNSFERESEIFPARSLCPKMELSIFKSKTNTRFWNRIHVVDSIIQFEEGQD
jgi:hypothetical protein